MIVLWCFIEKKMSLNMFLKSFYILITKCKYKQLIQFLVLTYLFIFPFTVIYKYTFYNIIMMEFRKKSCILYESISL